MSGVIGDPKTKHKSVEWYTPAWVFERLGVTFNVDPASPHDMETAVPANIKYTVFDDGLNQPWFGRVWLNPPYGKTTGLWMKRMIEHRNGIALVFSRTDAQWFQKAMISASAILFVRGRIEFIPGLENQNKVSRCGAGTAIFAFGEDNADALARLSDRGFFIRQRDE